MLCVLQERPDLSEMKASLMVNNAHMKAELSLLEDTILQMLSASQGNILDDEDLINTLAVSKVSLFPELLLGTEALSTMPAGKHFAVRLCVCCTFSREL